MINYYLAYLCNYWSENTRNSIPENIYMYKNQDMNTRKAMHARIDEISD